MKNQIIIHGTGKQTRIALIENNELAQLFIEAPENQRTVGDVYVAEVHKVMAGIRAAFINMGTPKDAFLHFSDVGDQLEEYIKMLNGDDAVDKAVSFNKELNKRYGNNAKSKESLSPGVEKQMRAGEVLQPGQKLLVQIVKEPIGSKGPRVSTDITIAGRFVVLIPMGNYVAVSKRIRSYKERRRLRSFFGDKLPDGFGIIVRTVAQNQPDEVLQNDIDDVLSKWKSILQNLNTAKPPQLLYRDLDMTDSLIRDLFAKDYNQVLIDDPKIFKQVKSYVQRVAPHMIPNIKLYKGKEHIFDYMRISQDVESVFSPRVKMKSGGYLIFEQTEAMYVVDVNSGRYAAKRHQEENSLRTNLESAREIAKQLRLRDIGGIIVVDFIDLKDDVNRKKVYDELKKEFRKDKAKTNLLPMSDFGLVQITRQRIRPSVVNSVSRVCPMCGGSGSVVSRNTIMLDLEAWIAKFRLGYQKRGVDLYINPYLKSFISRGLFSQRIKWMFKYRLNINVLGDETISMNDFKFTLPGDDVDITETVATDQPLEVAFKEQEEELSSLTPATKMDSSNLDVYKKNGHSKQRPQRQRVRRMDEMDDEMFDQAEETNSSKSGRASRSERSNSNDRKDRNDNNRRNNRSQSSDNTNSSSGQSKPNESVEEQTQSYPQALEVAKAYALKYNIDVKPVQKDDREDDYDNYEDIDSNNNSETPSSSPKSEETTSTSPEPKPSLAQVHYGTTPKVKEVISSESEVAKKSNYVSEENTVESYHSDESQNQADINTTPVEIDSEVDRVEETEKELVNEKVDAPIEASSQVSEENKIPEELVSIKSSIQFVEQETDDDVTIEVIKETVEVLESNIPMSDGTKPTMAVVSNDTSTLSPVVKESPKIRVSTTKATRNNENEES